MVLFLKNIIFFVLIFFVAGCARYKIPVQTENHPASIQAEVAQIELSSILNLPQESSCE